ncbi:DnaJ domain-containing protein [Pilaira anomala]|nr:DnaJ domain-containing protein [Pilaira anomala]
MDTAYADRERKQGNFYFNKGQFVEAEAFYSAAIASLPIGHSELVLLCNNHAAARLKLGKYHECLSDCTVAIDIARKQMTYSAILGDPTWRSQMIKALHRKASALEGLGMFEAAIQSYEEYIRLEGSRSAQVAQGIQRCQQALLEKRHPPPPPHPSQQQQQPPPQPPRPSTNGPNWKPSNTTSAFPDIDFNMFIPKRTPEQLATQEEINKSKAVKEIREREKQKEAEDLERLQNEDKVNAKIVSWKMGKDRNLRALLGSLHVILWPGVQWKSVQMSELLEPRKCKITYMKAIAKVHPDKLPANATVEQRMLASSIFTTLNQAWDLFKIENKL